MDTSNTALEDAFRVLGETPGKPGPKTISEPEVNDREPADQIAEPIQPEPSKTDQTGIGAAGLTLVKVTRRTTGQTVTYGPYEWIHNPLGITLATKRQIDELSAKGEGPIHVIQWPAARRLGRSLARIEFPCIRAHAPE